MSFLLSRYMHLLHTYPIPTKMVTSGTLFGAGDGIAQYMDGTAKVKGYNTDRTFKAVIWGGVIFAPIAHVWYNKVLEVFIPGTSTRAVLTKVALDQTIWGFFINSLYLSYAAVYINHGDLSSAKRSVETKIWPLMKANWVLWPAVQLVNFKFVPPPLQVPFINVVVLGWSAFMAMLATAPMEQEKKETAKIELTK